MYPNGYRIQRKRLFLFLCEQGSSPVRSQIWARTCTCLTQTRTRLQITGCSDEAHQKTGKTSCRDTKSFTHTRISPISFPFLFLAGAVTPKWGTCYSFRISLIIKCSRTHKMLKNPQLERYKYSYCEVCLLVLALNGCLNAVGVKVVVVTCVFLSLPQWLTCLAMNEWWNVFEILALAYDANLVQWQYSVIEHISQITHQCCCWNNLANPVMQRC